MSIPESSGWGKNTPDMVEKGQGSGLHEGVKRLLSDWVLLGCIVLTGTLCFGLGLLAARSQPTKGDSLWIEQLPSEEVSGGGAGSTSAASASASTNAATQSSVSSASQPAAAAAALSGSTASASGTYVASKTGTKYYLPSCATAKRIKDENKVWFNTKEEAEKAGYQPSTTCKGL